MIAFAIQSRRQIGVPAFIYSYFPACPPADKALAPADDALQRGEIGRPPPRQFPCDDGSQP
jgi:hypothetical protein